MRAADALPDGAMLACGDPFVSSTPLTSGGMGKDAESLCERRENACPCGLTLELSRPWRRARLAVRRMIGKQRCAAKRGRRSGSALERLVRPHCVRSGTVRGAWSLPERPARSG